MITDISQLNLVVNGAREDAFICADCMAGMRDFPDKFFDLAIDT